MFFSRAIVAVTAALPLLAAAAPRSYGKRDNTTYCGDGKISVSDGERLQLFQDFNDQLLQQKDVAGAFAKYVSPDLIEHTASASSYSDDVGFLSALLPTVDVTYINNIIGCGNSGYAQPICTLHYKAVPNSADSFVSNTTVISDFYRYDGSCIVEHWDSTQTANENTTNPNFPG